jgi:hypothetical protein
MMQDLADRLKEIQERLQVRDLVAVGDLVEHQMPPLTDRWQCMLVNLQQHLLEGAR